MEENKNLNPEIEILNTETNQEVSEKKETKNLFLEFKNKMVSKKKKIKNQNLLKKGSFSLAITIMFIAGAILINFLFGVLADKSVLEFDMSTQKINSISKENIDYIKGIKDKIDITFCGEAKNYAEGYMDYYAQGYQVQDENAADYYKQTVTLVEKYGDYNKNFNVKFLDTQSSEFTAIASKYSNSSLNYGDIIVSCEKDGNNRFKIIGYKDIYTLMEDQQASAYGYTSYTIGGNKIETALTSAISYVTSSTAKKIGFIKGHSKSDYTADFQEVLKDNNYEIVEIKDTLVTKIPDVDAIVIAAPTTDFIDSELTVISNFLENDGKYSKGLIFFADAASSHLTNLYDFLYQWGISIDEGILFETDANNHMPSDPLTMGLYSANQEDDISKDVNICITGYNSPMNVVKASDDNIEVKSIVATPESVVAAPQGVATSWTGYKDYEKKSFSGIIQSKYKKYDDDGNELSSYVMAFGSIEYIYSEYNENSSVSNKNVSLAVAERAAGSSNTGIKFISKTITNENYADAVTQAGTNLILIIFIISLPIACIVAGIVVYIKRRNS